VYIFSIKLGENKLKKANKIGHFQQFQGAENDKNPIAKKARILLNSYTYRGIL
jgi:hypothetical protein